MPTDGTLGWRQVVVVTYRVIDKHTNLSSYTRGGLRSLEANICRSQYWDTLSMFTLLPTIRCLTDCPVEGKRLVFETNMPVEL